MQELIGIFESWENKLDNDEWYFSNSFENIIDRLSSVEAYDYIPTVINELVKLRHSYLIGETLDFLHSLYNRADTTEIHPIMKNELEHIQNIVSQYGDDYGRHALHELKASLRIR